MELGQMESESSKRSMTTSVDTDSNYGSEHCVDTDSDYGSESDNSILLATDNDTNVKSKPIPAKRQKTRRFCGSA